MTSPRFADLDQSEGTYTVKYDGLTVKLASSYKAVVQAIKKDRDWHGRDSGKYKVTFTCDIPLSISI